MRNKILFFALILFLTSLFFLIKHKKNKIEKVSLFKTGQLDTISYKKNIKVGIASMISPSSSFIYYCDLLNYLKKRTNLDFTLKYGNYNEINELLNKEKLDLGFVCSGGYLQLEKTGKTDILAIPVINGKTFYHSYIITNKNKNINKFEDLKGKKFAFVDVLSASGYIYPVYLVLKKNYSLKDFFSEINFTYSHDISIFGVVMGKFDAAAVDSIIYEYLKKNQKEIIEKTKIIDISPPIGNPPVVVRKALDEKVKKLLTDFFLTINSSKEGVKILNNIGIEKFILPQSKEEIYKNIREMEKFIYRKL